MTGGETGIGRAIALRTLTDGANVAAAGINTELLDETLTLAHDVGPAERMAALPVDIRDVDQVQKMVDDTVMKFGRLDAVIANAGVMVMRRLFIELTYEEWHNVVAVNLFGTFFHTLQAATRVMKAQGDGAVICW